MPRGLRGFQKGELNPSKVSGAWNKGREMPKQTKEKLSEKIKEQFKNGRISWMKGKKHTEESNAKNRKAHLNKEAWNKGLKGYRAGSLNNKWKGGITSLNKKMRGTPETKIWRLEVFERDKFLCQMPNCDKTERHLNAHHIKKFIDYPELRFVLANGITLCKRCHNKTKGKEKNFENLFINISGFIAP